MKRLAEEEKTASDLLAALEAQAAKIVQREPQWRQLDTLLGHMGGLPEAPAITAERDAVHDSRLLLDDPDKMGPLVNRAADALRAVVSKTFNAYRNEYDHCTKELEAAQSGSNLFPRSELPSCVKCSFRRPRMPPNSARSLN